MLWQDKLPSHWELLPLKRLVNLKAERSIGNSEREDYIGLENIESWTGRLLKTRTFIEAVSDESNNQGVVNFFEPGDILFGKLRPYLAKAHLAEEAGTCTTELLVMQPHESICGGFLVRVVLTHDFIDLVNAETFGAKMPRADWDTIGNLPIPVPPLHEQRLIASYLNRQTATIDALIAAKQKLLTLLTEKRSALITHAVTRGLNPNVPLRDSGVEWLGKIPKHWEVENLKYHLSDIEQGWSPQSYKFPANEDEWGVLKVGAVNGWEFNPDENKCIPEELNIPHELEIQAGDILVSRANTTELVGSAALVNQVRPRLLLCDKLYRPKVCSDRLLPEYLVYYLRSVAGRFVFERDATGASSSMQNISQEVLANLWITIPPIDEQYEVIKHIKDMQVILDKLEVSTEKVIALLKERRTALISSVVTGSIIIQD
jgi:type I restriction enzyme S subunit